MDQVLTFFTTISNSGFRIEFSQSLLAASNLARVNGFDEFLMGPFPSYSLSSGLEFKSPSDLHIFLEDTTRKYLSCKVPVVVDVGLGIAHANINA